jgi:hypothetical protein
LDVLGWKSNSIYVALTELMLIRIGIKYCFLSQHPQSRNCFHHLVSCCWELLLYLHHRLIILRRWQREVGIGVCKISNAISRAKLCSRFKIYVSRINTWRINISLTSSSVVYEVVLTVIDCEKKKKSH